MRALLLLLLAIPCGAQTTFPSDEKDPDRLRNMEYLLEQVNVLRSSVTTNAFVPTAPVVRSYEIILSSLSITGTFIFGNSANSFNNICSSTIVWVADGVSTYTFTFDGSYSLNNGASMAVGWLLDSAYPNSRQTATQGLCSVQSISGENRTCQFRESFYVASGSHSACLRWAEGSNGDTITFGGSTLTTPLRIMVSRIGN